jgi:hypothetical protein
MLPWDRTPSNTHITFHSSKSLLALKGIVRIVLETVKGFNSHYPAPDIALLPATSPHCIFEAALIYIDLAGGMLDEKEWIDGLEDFKDALRYFGTRWKLAGTISSIKVIQANYSIQSST